ncbi:hypothetical protein ACOMHN_055097 [Nucella lapillus]
MAAGQQSGLVFAALGQFSLFAIPSLLDLGDLELVRDIGPRHVHLDRRPFDGQGSGQIDQGMNDQYGLELFPGMRGPPMGTLRGFQDKGGASGQLAGERLWL